VRVQAKRWRSSVRHAWAAGRSTSRRHLPESEDAVDIFFDGGCSMVGVRWWVFDGGCSMVGLRCARSCFSAPPWGLPGPCGMPSLSASRGPSCAPRGLGAPWPSWGSGPCLAALCWCQVVPCRSSGPPRGDGQHAWDRLQPFGRSRCPPGPGRLPPCSRPGCQGIPVSDSGGQCWAPPGPRAGARKAPWGTCRPWGAPRLQFRGRGAGARGIHSAICASHAVTDSRMNARWGPLAGRCRAPCSAGGATIIQIRCGRGAPAEPLPLGSHRQVLPRHPWCTGNGARECCHGVCAQCFWRRGAMPCALWSSAICWPCSVLAQGEVPGHGRSHQGAPSLGREAPWPVLGAPRGEGPGRASSPAEASCAAGAELCGRCIVGQLRLKHSPFLCSLLPSDPGLVPPPGAASPLPCCLAPPGAGGAVRPRGGAAGGGPAGGERPRGRGPGLRCGRRPCGAVGHARGHCPGPPGAPQDRGRECQRPPQALRAAVDGADYVGVGGVFPTATKENNATIGVPGLLEVCRGSPLPVVAIGGISEANAGAVFTQTQPTPPLAGVAVVSAVFDREDVVAATQLLWKSSRVPEDCGGPVLSPQGPAQ